MIAADIIAEVENLSKSKIEYMEALTGGGNNQVFLLKLGDITRVLKCYFHSGHDPRNRGQVEFLFSRLLWDSGERAIAEPLLMGIKGNWSLFEALEGTAIQVVNESHLIQAAKFIGRIKDVTHTAILPASEACEVNTDYVDILETRIKRLRSIDVNNELSSEVLEFVENKLLRKFQQIKEPIDIVESSFGIMSPSDFGFHNAILSFHGDIKFIDFEYAGVDDPCKLVCDFFSQPRVKVDLKFLPTFLDIAFTAAQANELLSRMPYVFPLVRLKWCCILLNEFLPDASSRRAFAMGQSVEFSYLKNQFEKSKTMYESIDEVSKGEMNALRSM